MHRLGADEEPQRDLAAGMDGPLSGHMVTVGVLVTDDKKPQRRADAPAWFTPYRLLFIFTSLQARLGGNAQLRALRRKRCCANLALSLTDRLLRSCAPCLQQLIVFMDRGVRLPLKLRGSGQPVGRANNSLPSSQPTCGTSRAQRLLTRVGRILCGRLRDRRFHPSPLRPRWLKNHWPCHRCRSCRRPASRAAT